MSSKPAKKPGLLWRVFRRLLWAALVLLVLGGMALGAGWYWLDKNILSTLPSDLSSLRDWRPPTNCRVYDSSQALVDEFYLERRIWVPLAELPPFLSQAFVAAEDRRFFRHKGVDAQGIIRALIVNYQTGSTRQGGSTITQQLVKNLLVGKERSYQRKIREAVLSFRLEKNLTKEEILELYINYVYLGSGNYGVEAAARDYFGVPASELNPGQAALLAGLVPAPSKYSPRASRELARQRREIVLAVMVEEDYLTPAEAASYRDDPVVQAREARHGQRVGLAYVTRVRRDIRQVYGEELPVQEGLQVFTPLDMRVQEVAETAVKEALYALEQRQGKRGVVQRLPKERIEGFLLRAHGMDRDNATGLPLHPEPGDCFEAMVAADRDLSKLLAATFGFSLREEDRMAKVRSELPEPAPVRTSTVGRVASGGGPSGALQSRVRRGDVLRVCLEEGSTVRLDPRPWAEGAALVMENATGRVIALVGGYNVTLEGFVRATQARRQPGSSFKPYVYAAAMLAGRTQLDKVVDGPISLPGGAGKRWTPKNYDGKFSGPVSLRRAMAKSLNTASVRLLLENGSDVVAATARSMGVQERLRTDPTLALGSSEVTLLDQVRGYATIARMGVPVTPVFLERAQKDDGTVVGVAGERAAPDWPPLPGGPLPRVLPAGVSYELADMLREVVRGGTARRAHKPGFDRAGKTGTTNGFVDAWFVGFTPKYTVGVWIGTDGTASLGDSETGGKAALPAWISIVEALDDEEGVRFAIPDEAALVQVEGEWLGLRRGVLGAQQLLPVARVGAEPLPFLSSNVE